MKACLPPVWRADARVLVLGSLPGEASLAAGQYYAHPRNLFWVFVGEVIGRDVVGLAYGARLAALTAAGVALWDVVARAVRPGSLDAALRDVEANDLATLVAAMPDLRAVAFNGGAAARIGGRALGGAAAGLARVALPSSSPAAAGVSRAVKVERWRVLRNYL